MIGVQCCIIGEGYAQVVNVLAAYKAIETKLWYDEGIVVSPDVLGVQPPDNCYMNRVCFAPAFNTGWYDDYDFLIYDFVGSTRELDPEDDAIFEDWASRDFRLAADSVLVDWGTDFVDVDPVTPGYQLLPNFDLAGKPRTVDGDGDGEPTVDVGAYEFQGGSP